MRQAFSRPRLSAASDVRSLAAATADAGSYADALALTTTAAEDLAASAPHEAALLLAEAVWYANGVHARALELARQAIRLGAGAEPDVELVLRSRLGDALQWNGRYREARRQWLRAAAGPMPRDPRLLTLRSAAQLRAGDLARARETAYIAAARAREAGERESLYDALLYAAIGEIHLGLLREAHGSALELEAVAGPAAGIDRLDAVGVAAWTEALLGREAECRRRLALAVELVDKLGVTTRGGMAAGLLALSLGRYEEAAERLRAKLGDRLPVAGAISLRPFLDALVEACVRAGRVEEAHDLVARSVDEMLATGQPRYRALGLRMRAIASGKVAAFEDALGEHARWGNHFEEARTRLAYAEALRRAKERGAAREQAGQAAAAFTEVGARLWAARARAELRAAGARVPRPATGAALTPQEDRIARLVVEGLSNKEIAARLFLSTRTIEGHLRNVFGKLGVTSRTQLIRALDD